MKKKLTYKELEDRLLKAEEALRAIQSGEIDVIIGEKYPLVVKSKETEEALRAAQEQLELAISGSNASVWDLKFDPNNPYEIPDEIFISPRLKEFIGFKDEEFPNSVSAWQRRILPEDLEVVKKSAQDHLEGRRDIHEAEYRIYHKDGSIRWIHTRGKIYRDEKGAPKRWTGIDWDITEQKKQEEALRESESRYRNLVEYSQAMICTHDLEGRILSVNKRAEKVLGIGRDKILKMSIQEILAPEVRGQFPAYIAALCKEGLAKGLMVVQTASGEKRIWQYFNTLRTEVGKAPEVLGTAFDVTEPKKIEEELRLSEEKFRGFFENAPLYCFMVSPDKTILDVNKAALSALGYTKEELVGKPIEVIYPPEYFSKVEENFEIWRKSGRLAETEMEIVSKRGERRTVILSAGAIRDKKGKILNSISMQRDITERKRLEQQLQQSQRMEAIGRLAGGVAHDFNNLLTVIKAHSQLMLSQLKEGDPLRDGIEEIERSADRAANLTRQLLAFSRRQVMEFRVLDVNEVIKGMEKMLRRVLGEDIELVAYYTDGLGRVKADPGQLEQVLMNLVVNARDAMPKGGKLTIETANVELDEGYVGRHVGVKAGSYVMFSVTDTGVGMTPEVRERIFEPFFTTKEMGKGTGLGLSTVYGIVKQSGGNIWVYSELGKGTTFKVYLPRVEGEVEEVRRKEEVKEVLRGREVILLVEDDDMLRKLGVAVLRRYGYEVLEASLPAEALLLVEKYQGKVDLVLTDVVMPQMSGRELGERIKKWHPGVKVLYMSGYTDNSIAHHGVLEPGLDFLQKPFSVEGLARKVREVLDKEKGAF